MKFYKEIIQQKKIQKFQSKITENEKKLEEVKKNSEEIIEIQNNIKRDIIIARKHAENGNDQEGVSTKRIKH